MSQIKKVVLAYSGGLDTSIIIPWLKRITTTARRSSQCPAMWARSTELDGLEEKAIKTGASKLYIVDLTWWMNSWRGLRHPHHECRRQVYEDYLLGTSSPGRSSPSAWWKLP